MQQAAYFSNKPFKQLRGHATRLGVRLSSNLQLYAGQLLAQISATAASDVQTLAITGGTPSSGSFNLNFQGQYVAVPYNTTAAALQLLLQALPAIGTGNILCTSGPLPGTSIVMTFAGAMANLPQPAMTVTNSTLSAGTAAVTHTTTGVAFGRFVAYNGTLLAPTTAPTLAGNGSGSSFAAGSPAVSYTYVTAAGESTPSPAAMVTLTAGQNIQVGALSSLNAAITAINVYVDGDYAGQIATSAGATAATNISGGSITKGQTPPTINQAFQYSDGSQVPKSILAWDTSTNNQGQTSFGQGGQTQWNPDNDVDSYISGIFQASLILGLDANATTVLGARYVRRSAGDPNAEILIPGP